MTKYIFIFVTLFFIQFFHLWLIEKNDAQSNHIKYIILAKHLGPFCYFTKKSSEMKINAKKTRSDLSGISPSTNSSCEQKSIAYLSLLYLQGTYTFIRSVAEAEWRKWIPNNNNNIKCRRIWSIVCCVRFLLFSCTYIESFQFCQSYHKETIIIQFYILISKFVIIRRLFNFCHISQNLSAYFKTFYVKSYIPVF